MTEVITKFQKNAREEVRATLNEYRGKQVVGLRVWVKPDAGEERIPTPKGLTLAVSCFPKLKKAIDEVEKTLKEKGLLNDGE